VQQCVFSQRALGLTSARKDETESSAPVFQLLEGLRVLGAHLLDLGRVRLHAKEATRVQVQGQAR
jgi:hypothetical protein